MKVKELIEKLEALSDEDKELTVITEGCDCMGDIDLVHVDHDRTWDNENDKLVVLTRPEYHDTWIKSVEERERRIKDNGPLQLP